MNDPSRLRLTIEIEGTIDGKTTVHVTDLAMTTDGKTEHGEDNPVIEADSFIGGILIASQELRKLGVLLGLELINAVGPRLTGTGEGIENAHAAADYAAKDGDWS